MPDDRLFHVRLLQSEKVDKLTDFERCVWFACRLACDDFGVMRFSANSLQEAARFLEKRSKKIVEKAFAQVVKVDLIRTFEFEGRTYCYQHDWQDWQKVDYPRTTLNPKPPDSALADCSLLTRKLFDLYPGGWRGKKPPKESAIPAEVLPTPSAIPPEGVPNVSAIPDRKPLAVSRKPVAVSQEPLAVVPAAAIEARSHRPIFKGQRFVVFEWMLDDLRKLLGPYFEDFNIDAWFYDLDAKAAAASVVVPQRDGGKWVQEQTLAEAMRRGLAIAAAPQSSGKTAGNAAAMQRFAARGRS